MADGIRAVVFDFDGTLADSYQPITDSVNHVRAKHGLGPLAVEEVRRFVGRGVEYLLNHTVPDCDLEKDVPRYRAHHPSVMFQGTVLLPGARETAEALHRAGLLLAICSNKPRNFTRRLVEHLGLDSVFQAVLGPEDVPRPKPAPDMLLTALSRLDTTREESLYVGDMVVDIQTARAAGVPVWVVPTGLDTRDALEAARPDCILDNLASLPQTLP